MLHRSLQPLLHYSLASSSDSLRDFNSASPQWPRAAWEEIAGPPLSIFFTEVKIFFARIEFQVVTNRPADFSRSSPFWWREHEWCNPTDSFRIGRDAALFLTITRSLRKRAFVATRRAKLSATVDHALISRVKSRASIVVDIVDTRSRFSLS
jgi:hypothetical protein